MEEAPYVFYRQIGSVVANSTERAASKIRAETEAQLAVQAKRLDDLERQVRRNNRYDEITDDLLHEVVLARLQSDDDSPYWEFCTDHHISMAQLTVMLKDFERRTGR
jgi:hypothetical protein